MAALSWLSFVVVALYVLGAASQTSPTPAPPTTLPPTTQPPTTAPDTTPEPTTFPTDTYLEELTTCETMYTSPDCDTVQQLNGCLGDVLSVALSVNPSTAMRVIYPSAVAKFMNLANQVEDCNFITFMDALGTASVASDGSVIFSHNIVDERGLIIDTMYFRYSKGTHRYLELADYVANAPDVSEFAANVDQMTQSSVAGILASLSALSGSLGSQANSLGDSYMANLPSLASQIVVVNQSVTVDVPYQNTQVFQTLQANINREGLNRETTRISITDRIAAALASVTASNANDMRDMLQVVNDDFNYRQGLVNTISSTVAAFSSQESTRAAVKSTSVIADTTTASTSMSTTISTGFSTELSRIVAKGKALASAAVAAALPAKQTGSNDNKACSSSQAGQMYYSTGTGTFYICDGTWWMTPFPFSGTAFRSSRIVDQALAQALMRRTSYTKWLLCYSGSIHGWSSYTFHNNCNNKGATLMVLRDQYGLVYGSYHATSWYSPCNYISVSTNNNYIYRYYNGQIDFAYNSQNTYYSGYDCASYCPTFGGGHDLYINSNCNSGYFSMPYSYNYYNTDSYYITARITSSVSGVQQLEVYYKG